MASEDGMHAEKSIAKLPPPYRPTHQDIALLCNAIKGTAASYLDKTTLEA